MLNNTVTFKTREEAILAASHARAILRNRHHPDADREPIAHGMLGVPAVTITPRLAATELGRKVLAEIAANPAGMM